MSTTTDRKGCVTGPAHWVKVDDELVATDGTRSTVLAVTDRRDLGYFRVQLQSADGDIFVEDLSTNANVVYYRTLANRMLNFALAALVNNPPEVNVRGMRERAQWAAEHAATIARAGGETVSEDDEYRLALAVQVAALSDLETYGRANIGQ